MKKSIIIFLFPVAFYSCGINQEEVNEASRQGKEFGEKVSQEKCLSESLANVASCSTNNCGAKVYTFFSSCFEVASKSHEICKGIPEDRGSFRDEDWRIDRCKKLGQGENMYCKILHRKLQAVCSQ